MTNQSEQPEAKKPVRQILLEEITEGRLALFRPPLGLALSAFSAGLDIGFSLMLMAAMRTMLAGHVEEVYIQIINANLYAVGFVFVVLGRSELFTEHTSLAVLPVLGGRATLKDLARLWAIVYFANLAGTAVFAGIAVFMGPRLGIISLAAFEHLSRSMHQHPAEAIVFSAIFGGWLMGLLSWLVTAARETISQVVIVWLVTGTIGLLHAHHAIVGSVEVLAGVFAGQGTTWADFGHFLGWTTLGNAIGGVVFVALLKYSHASRPGEQEE